MRTGIIGTGRIGSTLARILVAAGHQVVLANARGPQTLGPLVAELGRGGAGGPPPPAPPPGRQQVLMGGHETRPGPDPPGPRAGHVGGGA
ncbi:NAD(P)-binding domain-containing protein, partial [Streptomyces spororaveus]|uniref:NAD(P)-binding domain-containing protein n=1 Tax=Streptomyces spororaveus TaxID=284039 RepID=UPI0037B3032E